MSDASLPKLLPPLTLRVSMTWRWIDPAVETEPDPMLPGVFSVRVGESIKARSRRYDMVVAPGAAMETTLKAFTPAAARSARGWRSA
ncbi:hypothetical protein GCM10023170_017440 [Phytohabitans houttuyneae]|uniref:Uncharacterized protein n=1 Tax=Phytohabitans houttuyneae TaxID=1076126 RepID=A0A6V8KU15_9ACTN|nr:hypothetical protein Phou_100010 [Phytohabitans houttuyneae]